MLHDVMSEIASESKARGTGKTEPRRYVMFTLAEWQATINKAFGRDVGVGEIKQLLLLLCNGKLVAMSAKRNEELLAAEALVKSTK